MEGSEAEIEKRQKWMYGWIGWIVAKRKSREFFYVHIKNNNKYGMEIGNAMNEKWKITNSPIFSKDAFPAHFRTNGGIPMPIDFSALRHSELNGGRILLDDAPTPIGSQKGPGQGAVLMEIAHQQMENNKSTTQTEQNQQSQHQGAFRRVLRRTRRNSNSQNQQPVATIAARTVSPLGIGLGEKRRWDAPINNGEEEKQLAATTTTTQTTTTIQPELETMPIAARTRGSLLMGMLGGGKCFTKIIHI